MTSLEKKIAAFAAWDRNILSDAELKTLRDAFTDTLETLEAMGERGLITAALRMRLWNVENMISCRARG